jgi:hypothetical protein
MGKLSNLEGHILRTHGIILELSQKITVSAWSEGCRVTHGWSVSGRLKHRLGIANPGHPLLHQFCSIVQITSVVGAVLSRAGPAGQFMSPPGQTGTSLSYSRAC